MARIEIDPNYSSPTFSRATAGTDLFKKEDVQALAAAISTHTHGTGKGLPVDATAIPNGSITSAMIVDGTIAAGDLAANSVTTAKIADGAVTNAKLASDTARLNLLTNGGFEIWQRGNGPFTANTGYTADRWSIGLGGSDTLSVSRDTTNVDTAGGSQFAAACTFVLSGGGGASNLVNSSKLADNYNIANRTLSASVRVRTTTASAVRLGLYNGSAFAYSNYHTGGGAWETLTVTATMGASGGSLGQFSVMFAASCTAYVDNAMLVVGSVPADYAPLHPSDDLARCLRYYEQTVKSSTTAIDLCVTHATNATNGVHYFKVIKVVNPTVTFSPAANFTVTANGVTATTCNAMSTFEVDAERLWFSAGVAGTPLTTGHCSKLSAASGQNAGFVFEANP